MYLPSPYYPQPPLGLSVASLFLIDGSMLPNVMESFHTMRDMILGGDDYDEMRWGMDDDDNNSSNNNYNYNEQNKD